MLVLKRKQAESVVIDGCIRITVLRVHGGAISLGIEAPEEVRIRRSELSGRSDESQVRLFEPTRDAPVG
jgi:carbon storage regulator